MSGCLFYPIFWTCLPVEYLSWGVSPELTKDRYDIVTALGKGWSSYVLNEGKVDDRILYFQPLSSGLIVNVKDYLSIFKYTWVKYWLQSGDAVKILNNFLIILFCFFILLFSKKKIEINNTISKTLIFMFLLNLLLWFYLTPQSIYGGNLVTIAFSALLVSSLLKNIDLKSIFTISIFCLLIMISFIYNFSRNYEKFNNFFDNIKYPFNGLIEVSNNNIDIDFYKKTFNGYEVNIKKKIANRHEGLPDFCGNISMLCMPIDRIDCVSKIEKKYNYLFITGNIKKCKAILKTRIFY